MRWRDVALGLAIALALVSAALYAGKPAPQAPEVTVEDLVPLAPDTLTLGLPVRPGSTLGELLAEHHLDANAIRAAALPDYDLAKIRPDREIQVVYVDGEVDPVAVRYEVDADHVVVVERDGQGWVAHVEEVLYDKALGTRAFAVTRSLWLDGIDAGLSPADLVEIAKVFEYEVDFNTEIQDGDSLRIAADVESAPGHADRLADLYAIRLDSGDTSLVVVRHVAADGTVGWYHPDGTGTKRPFLRSPLEFSRVTSGFDRHRYHPILKTTRAHNGVDLGAATGTPVRAVASGVVEIAGVQGGHGKYVQLDHEGPWQTSYSHLSRIRVKKGQHVRQGDIIGEVGETGLATGPHLHYQMWRNGVFVDPMKVELPVQEPLPVAEKDAFDADVAKYLPLIEAAGAALSGTGTGTGTGTGISEGPLVTPKLEASRPSPE